MARSNGVRKMFDHSGLATPPCGTPVVVGCHFPASITPASRKLRIKCRTRPSLISAAIRLTSFLAGLLRPDGGDILIGGKVLANGELREWRHGIGYLTQEPFLFHDTIRANLLI